jgi:hypothetical protein
MIPRASLTERRLAVSEWSIWPNQRDDAHIWRLWTKFITLIDVRRALYMCRWRWWVPLQRACASESTFQERN